MTDRYILSIDQGTTSSRAILFDADCNSAGTMQREFKQHYPQKGWVEHDAMEIWNDVKQLSESLIEAQGLTPEQITAIGITNQRETTVIWDRKTGKPIHHAIVWQDRRTAAYCTELKAAGHEDDVNRRTGLLLDPYFSATKVKWILDHVEGARDKAEAGELAFGTIDSWLLYCLTEGKTHATDYSNAARTMLLNIESLDWDNRLLDLFDIPRAILPELVENAADIGMATALFDGHEIPVTGMAGDQQAASFGQACFKPGMVKSTYGTGCFALVNTGTRLVPSKNRLLTTIGWRIGGVTSYAIEGSIFVAGAAVQWLRDRLGMIEHAAETEDIAASLEDSGGVYFLPAFAGLGAPYWDSSARAAITGLTLDSGREHIIRAALEAQAYQTRDLLSAMQADMKAAGGEGMADIKQIRIDGGMVSNNWVCQYLADILQMRVDRPVIHETTAMGAAMLAGLYAGFYDSQTALAEAWQGDRSFLPEMEAAKADAAYAGWLEAVDGIRSTEAP